VPSERVQRDAAVLSRLVFRQTTLREIDGKRHFALTPPPR
jgi:hypothetical protein